MPVQPVQKGRTSAHQPRTFYRFCCCCLCRQSLRRKSFGRPPRRPHLSCPLVRHKSDPSMKGLQQSDFTIPATLVRKWWDHERRVLRFAQNLAKPLFSSRCGEPDGQISKYGGASYAPTSLEKRQLRFADPNNGHRTRLTAFFRQAQGRSKRSRFITLVHAATKSLTNFSSESAHA